MADFGLTEDMYGTNYFRQNSEERHDEKVPIRWMAPESLERDIYTQSTDVVSSQASFLIRAWVLPGPYEPPKVVRSIQLCIIAQNGVCIYSSM